MSAPDLFCPAKASTTKITTSTTTAATAISVSKGYQVSVKNMDVNDTVFIDFGVSTDTVTATNGIPIGPGDIRGFTVPGSTTHVLTIASANTPALYITMGWGF